MTAKFENQLTKVFIIILINFLGFCRMVLLVRGVVQDEPPPDTRTLYLNHPVLRDSASQLLTISTKVVGPIGLLYVCQREMAVTVPHDSTYYYKIMWYPRVFEKWSGEVKHLYYIYLFQCWG